MQHSNIASRSWCANKRLLKTDSTRRDATTACESTSLDWGGQSVMWPSAIKQITVVECDVLKVWNNLFKVSCMPNDVSDTTAVYFVSQNQFNRHHIPLCELIAFPTNPSGTWKLLDVLAHHLNPRWDRITLTDPFTPAESDNALLTPETIRSSVIPEEYLTPEGVGCVARGIPRKCESRNIKT